ncbi:hypothetical protein ACQ0QR_26875, partial [Klebsiella pneumoniae]
SAKGDDKFITTDYLQQCRKQYGALTKRRDRAGAAALEEAVLRALRAPIRKAEEK